LLARCERTRDADVTVRLSGEARRIIGKLPRKQAKEPESTLDDIVREIGGG